VKKFDKNAAEIWRFVIPQGVELRMPKFCPCVRPLVGVLANNKWNCAVAWLGNIEKIHIFSA